MCVSHGFYSQYHRMEGRKKGKREGREGRRKKGRRKEVRKELRSDKRKKGSKLVKLEKKSQYIRQRVFTMATSDLHTHKHTHNHILMCLYTTHIHAKRKKNAIESRNETIHTQGPIYSKYNYTHVCIPHTYKQKGKKCY